MIADKNLQSGLQPIRCPVCNKEFLPSAASTMPFCSDRCQKIDLGRWLNEGYGLPVEGQEDVEFNPEDDDPGQASEF